MIPDGFVDVSVIIRSGVYLLLWKGEVVYVGQSERLSSRVNSHVYSQGKHRKQMLGNRTIKGPVFDQVCVMRVLTSDLDRVEKELISRYQPRYNIMHRQKKIPVNIMALLAQIAPTLPAAPEPRAYIRRRI